MRLGDLRRVRLARGWTQSEAAARLGVSQPYYSQLESGDRPLLAELGWRAVRDLGLSPVALPVPGLDPRLDPMDSRELGAQLALFGYPGFTHMKKAVKPMNPAFVVASALGHSDLDTRLVEALPWVLRRFDDLDWVWLAAQCRLLNQQNRLGYLVSLALQLGWPRTDTALREALSELERSRLAVEGTLCRDSMAEAERAWVRKHRPAQAAHWRLLTTLTVEQLTHAA